MIYIFAVLSVLWDFVFKDVLMFFPAFLGLALYRRKTVLFFLVLLIRFLAMPNYWYIIILFAFLILDVLRSHFSSMILPASVLIVIGCVPSGFVSFALSALFGVFLLLWVRRR
ncbi:hypothetical protein [Thermotoga sp. SG1]|uniref:hypothetical protein n=1 Tax=Thermotoga sp. SG1 TaxID=126739 RepID=UPI000C770088|nr:hypothetical protein [Thermotoga sp. SG1]PLV56718.1 hypothetical protein AS006_03710 [Thermotoga sp. SG1]